MSWEAYPRTNKKKERWGGLWPPPHRQMGLSPVRIIANHSALRCATKSSICFCRSVAFATFALRCAFVNDMSFTLMAVVRMSDVTDVSVFPAHAFFVQSPSHRVANVVITPESVTHCSAVILTVPSMLSMTFSTPLRRSRNRIRKTPLLFFLLLSLLSIIVFTFRSGFRAPYLMLRIQLYKRFGCRKLYRGSRLGLLFWKEGNALTQSRMSEQRGGAESVENYCTTAETVFR